MKALLTLLCSSLLLACEAQDMPAGDDEALPVARAAREPPSSSPVAESKQLRPVIAQPLAYGEGEGRNLVGYLAMPEDAIEPLPGVIVIHEWSGLNDDIKLMTRRVAAQGYVALAVDLYNGALADTPAAAEQLMTSVMMNQDIALANVRQAYDYLEKYALAPRVAAVGFSLGGSLALQTALMLPEDLDAVVIYYGQVINDEAELKTLQMPLLGLFAAEDRSVPVTHVQQFRASLRELGKRADVFIYSDVGHDFANPSGETYDEKTAAEAWSETLEFLGLYL